MQSHNQREGDFRMCGQDVLRICLAPRLSKTAFQDVPRKSAAIQRFEFMSCCQKSLGNVRRMTDIAALQQLQHCSSSTIAAAALQQQQLCNNSSIAAAAAALQQQHCSSSSINIAAAATLQQQHSTHKHARGKRCKTCEISDCPLCITNECPWRSQWKQIHDVLDACPVYFLRKAI